MNLWLVMLAAGILTFSTRLSFILLLERMRTPDWVQRALRFVPPAVLAAIITPELLMVGDGALSINLLNPRLVAGLLAGVIAWKTKNVIWAIAGGMICLIALELL